MKIWRPKNAIEAPVAFAAVRSKAKDLLLLVPCLLLIPLFWGRLVLLCSTYIKYATISLLKEEIVCCFTLTLFSCFRSVSVPQGAIGWSSVCDCGSSWSSSLT